LSACSAAVSGIRSAIVAAAVADSAVLTFIVLLLDEAD
jgi:hypothetical protein